VRKTTILNVDDYEPSRYYLTKLLHEAGYEVSEAARGEQGIELARSVRPDLILMDIMLPDLNGLDVARLLKSDPDLSDVPILSISATYDASESEIRESRADAYILRPVPDSVLLAAIRALLAGHDGDRGLQASEGRWDEFVDTLTQPICLIDLEGAILRWNQPFARLIGQTLPQSAEAASGATQGTLQDEVFRLLNRMTDERRTQGTSLHVGDEEWELSLLPVWNDSQVLVGAAVLARQR
jgi:CheY-like chemotaxis protein